MSTGKVVVGTVEDVGDVAGKLFRIPIVLIQNAALIGIVALVGFAGIAFRDLLIVSCPFIAEHAVAFAAAFDLIIAPLYVACEVLVDIVRVLIAIKDKIQGRPPPHFPPLKFVAVSAETVRRFFSNLPARCVDYVNVGYCLSKATKAQTNKILCPLVRITYPVPWMWDTTNALFGWGIANAVPQGTYIEDGVDGNCDLADQPTDWLCVGLSVGYVVVDILLPVLLVTVLWPYTVSPLLRLGYHSAKRLIAWVWSKVRPGKV